jgi:hypothetical protein
MQLLSRTSHILEEKNVKDTASSLVKVVELWRTVSDKSRFSKGSGGRAEKGKDWPDETQLHGETSHTWQGDFKMPNLPQSRWSNSGATFLAREILRGPVGAKGKGKC